MNENNEKTILQEDEIDLRELFLNIWEQKLFIFIFTTAITIISIVYAYSKTPIYEVTSNIQVGFIGEELITNPEVLQKKTEAYFQAMDSKQNSIEFISKVTEISQPKTVKDFITIKTEAHSNDNAMERNKEVVKYIQDLNNQKIQQYMSDIRYQIINTKKDIENINNFEKINVLNEINKIKTQEIKQIDEKIERLKTQDIAKLKEEIEKIKQQDLKKIDEKINLLKTQDVPRIENQIKFLLENKIKQIDSKISFNQENLIKYNENVKKIYSETKNTDNTTLLTVSSLQMTNYQNLILNAQNKIEDLKLEKKTIIEETIPELKLKKENILNLSISDLESDKENIINFKLKNLNNQIDNINDVTITNLERNKLNISSDKIRKLEYKYNVDLPSKELKLKEKIRQLEFKISDENIQNSVVVGDYLLSDYPIKPKKKLIVVVAFVTGLILSIFLSLFIAFIRNKK